MPAQGTGPHQAGKRVLYRKEAIADWLKSREVSFAVGIVQAAVATSAVTI